MRDLLNQIDLLVESAGLANRKQGDIFKNKEGNSITFNEISFYPQEGGKLSQEQFDSLLQQLEGQVKWQNSKLSKSLAIIIARFEGPEGPLNYGFFKNEIKPNKLDNFIPNKVDDYKFAGKSAEKIQSGLTPQDLLTKRDNLTKDEIIQQLAETLGENNILVQVATKVANGDKYPIKFPAPENVSFTGFRDYFCEILQPMALQNGQYKGNAGEAAERFMDGSFADTFISFDMAKNAGLSDSILSKSNGKYIKISTKGERGASASVKNLVDALRELEQNPNGKKLKEKYKDTIDIIEKIESLGQVKAPLALAVDYELISSEDFNTILKLKNIKPVNLKTIKQTGLSDNLKKLALERKTDDPTNVNLYYHLIAGIAHLVAKKVNDETDFSNAASDILNNGALVQVYTEVKQLTNEWELKEFNTVYPGKSIQGVYLSAGKTYYSTGIKGNFTFRINKDSVKPEVDIDQEIERPKTEKEFTKGATSIARGLRQPKEKESKLKGGVGRKKRK